MSEDRMTKQDQEDAADALCNWLQSQGITHEDGAIVIARVIGSMLATNATSHLDLASKISGFNNMITVASETAWFIRAHVENRK